MTREGQSSAIQRFFASRLFLIIALCIALLFALGYARAYYQDYKVKQQIAALKEDVSRLEKRKLESLRILQYVMSPSFVEERARTELNLQKPGEHTVVLERRASMPVASSTAGGPSGQKIGNPLKWWYYFTH